MWKSGKNRFQGYSNKIKNERINLKRIREKQRILQEYVMNETYKNTWSAKSQCLKDIGSTANPTIKKNRYPTLHGFNYLRFCSIYQWRKLKPLLKQFSI